MKRKWISLFISCAVMLMAWSAWANDGVYVSSSSPSTPDIKDYVQRVAISLLVKKTGEILDHTFKQQKTQLFPQLMYWTAQKTAQECFNQPDLLKIIRQAYDHGVETADEQIGLKASGAIIQNKVTNIVQRDIDKIVSQPYYRLIVEQMIQQAMIKQRTIILQKSVETELARMVIQQKVMEAALEQQYRNMVQGIH